MCGISIIFDRRGRLTDDPIKNMVNVLKHRGPDSNAFFRCEIDDAQLFSGATRLKITENSPGADQPFFSPDRSSLILFNGEIYNFFDLKNEMLKEGIQFRSNSDTEVLLNWLDKYEGSRLDELEGMFAFMYVNLKTGQMIMARDRFGMKPLFYYQDNDYLIITSELRAMLASGLVKKELNETQIPHYFNFRYSCPPHTFYKNIFQIPFGHKLIVKDGCLSEPVKYDHPKYNDHQKPVVEFRELIKESLYKHASASRGIGVLLSGGIDSSLMLALLHEEGIQLPCFSVFSRWNRNEQELAESMVKKTHATHQILEVDQQILTRFHDYVEKLDQPISDSAGYLTFLISGYASNDVKILLSGAGADELFGGYNRHAAFYRFFHNQNISLKLKQNIWPLFKGVLPQPINGFFRSLEKDPGRTYQNFIRIHFSNLSKHYKVEKNLMTNTPDPLRDILLEDKFNYLPQDVLAISDTMSMAAGMEMRMPFLDNHLNAAVNSCSPDYILKKGQKWILKEILADYVNPTFLKQKKVGFGLPLKHWLAEKENSHLWDLFDNKNSYIFRFVESSFFDYLLTSHQRHRGDFSQELWSILTLAYWLEKEFN